MSTFGAASAPYERLYKEFGIPPRPSCRRSTREVMSVHRHAPLRHGGEGDAAGLGRARQGSGHELQRLGCEVIAVDRYATPAQRVAHRSTSAMTDAAALRAIVEA
jgi:hypothetical protein